MSSVGPEGRSFEQITMDDLRRLATLAAEDGRDFFDRFPDWAKLYEDRVLCTALCQGAALHFARGGIGINDFDVYTFYAQHPKRAWYAKRRRGCDFGDQKFGKSQDKPNFVGRRVDLMGRGIPAEPTEEPVRAVQRYLSNGRTKSARLLAQKAVVVIEPSRSIGQIIWLDGSPVD